MGIQVDVSNTSWGKLIAVGIIIITGALITTLLPRILDANERQATNEQNLIHGTETHLYFDTREAIIQNTMVASNFDYATMAAGLEETRISLLETTTAQSFTPLPTDTPVFTPTSTLSPTPTFTATSTQTFTYTPTPTDTPTNTLSPTFTHTLTATHTPTITRTPTPTPTPRSTGLQLGESYSKGNIRIRITGVSYATSALWGQPYIVVEGVIDNISQRTLAFSYDELNFSMVDNLGNEYAPAPSSTSSEFHAGRSMELRGQQCCGVNFYVNWADRNITSVTFIVMNLSSVDRAEWVLPIDH